MRPPRPPKKAPRSLTRKRSYTRESEPTSAAGNKPSGENGLAPSQPDKPKKSSASKNSDQPKAGGKKPSASSSKQSESDAPKSDGEKLAALLLKPSDPPEGKKADVAPKGTVVKTDKTKLTVSIVQSALKVPRPLKPRPSAATAAPNIAEGRKSRAPRSKDLPSTDQSIRKVVYKRREATIPYRLGKTAVEAAKRSGSGGVRREVTPMEKSKSDSLVVPLAKTNKDKETKEGRGSKSKNGERKDGQAILNAIKNKVSREMSIETSSLTPEALKSREKPKGSGDRERDKNVVNETQPSTVNNLTVALTQYIDVAKEQLAPSDDKDLLVSVQAPPRNMSNWGGATTAVPRRVSRKKFSFEMLYSDVDLWRLRTRRHLVVFLLVQFVCGLSITTTEYQAFTNEISHEEYAECLAEYNRTDLNVDLLTPFHGHITFLDANLLHTKGFATKRETRIALTVMKTRSDMILATSLLSVLLLSGTRIRKAVQIGLIGNCIGYLLLTQRFAQSMNAGAALLCSGYLVSFYFAKLATFDSMAYWMRILVYAAGQLSFSLGNMVAVGLVYLLREWKTVYWCNFAITLAVSAGIAYFIEECYSSVLLSMNLEKIMKLFYIEDTVEHRAAMERLLEETLYREAPLSSFQQYFQLLKKNRRVVAAFALYGVLSVFVFNHATTEQNEQAHLHLRPFEGHIVRALFKAIGAVITYCIMRLRGLRFTLVSAIVLCCVHSAVHLSLDHIEYDHCHQQFTHTRHVALPGTLSDHSVSLGIFLLRHIAEEMRAASLIIWFFELVPSTIRHHAYFLYIALMTAPAIGLSKFSGLMDKVMFGVDWQLRACFHLLLLPLFLALYHYDLAPVTVADLDNSHNANKRLYSLEDTEVDHQAEAERFHNEQNV